jgi:dinuclear metal center YbgI/SA1388 family protein
LQESYDNCGVQVGDTQVETDGAVVCIDVTEAVVDEAIAKNCKMIISHHPLIFKGLKSVTGKNYVERCLLKAIKNDICIYACHTNLDNAWGGVSFKMAEKLGLKNVRILTEMGDKLVKLVTFVPTEQAASVRDALFRAGAGHIGDYDRCSYNTTGYGTFRAGEGCNPFCGTHGEDHQEEEVRIESIFPVHLQGKVVDALTASHPYEEPAYDLYPLKNSWSQAGSGVVGELLQPTDELTLLHQVKSIFGVDCLKHSPLRGRIIQKVALCGGSGSFLINDAMRAGADLFITGEIGYHHFFNHENRILLAETGHYESEQYTIELICEIIRKKITTFAVHFTECKTNQINYL